MVTEQFKLTHLKFLIPIQYIKIQFKLKEIFKLINRRKPKINFFDDNLFEQHNISW